MNEIALATNDGHLLLYRFQFPRLTPVVRAKIADVPLYLPQYNKYKNVVVTDRKTVQIYYNKSLAQELPVEQVRDILCVSTYHVLCTSVGTFIYDNQFVFTKQVPSNMAVAYKKAAILADSKYLHFYQLGGEITAKFNYQKHLNQFLVGFAVIGERLVCCGQRKVISIDIATETVVGTYELTDGKISCFHCDDDAILLGLERGGLVRIQLGADCVFGAARIFYLCQDRVKQIRSFGALFAYCATGGEFGLVFFDEDGSLSRVCSERVGLRLNGMACCGGVSVSEEAFGGEEE